MLTLFRATRLSRSVTGASISRPPPSPPAYAAPLTCTLLSVSVTCSSVSGRFVKRPPAKPDGVEAGFVLAAVTAFPLITTLRIVAAPCGKQGQPGSTLMPPASPAGSSVVSDPVYGAVFPLITLFCTSSAPPLPIPPASAWFAIGLFTVAWLPLMTLSRTISVAEKWLAMPPEPTSLAADGSDAVDPDVLFVTREFVSVRTPPFAIPPPLLKPQAKKGLQKPDGMTACEVTVLPVITLFAIETVAPVLLNGGWSSCATRIETPPPNVTASPGAESFRPPVIVTPAIETFIAVGST